MKWQIHSTIVVSIVMLLAPLAGEPLPILVWNASASVPVGLYTVRPSDEIENGDLAVVRLTKDHETLLRERGIIRNRVPLIKPVAASGGQRVCRRGAEIFIDGHVVARASERFSDGFPLPVWSGCKTLSREAVFLLAPTEPRSFDGRYLGPTARSDVIGRAVFLWKP